MLTTETIAHTNTYTPYEPICVLFAGGAAIHVPPGGLPVLRPLLQPRGHQQLVQGHELHLLPAVPGRLRSTPPKDPGPANPGESLT